VLTNLGTVAVNISSIQVTGADPGDFAIQPSSTCSVGTPVPPTSGNSCSIVVAFQPAAAGARSATLSTADNGGGSQSVSLKGTGVATLVSITVTPASPTLAVGSTQQFTATGTYRRQHHKEPEQLCYLEFISHRSCNRQQRLRHTRPSACDRRRFNRHRCNLRDCKWDSYADGYAVKRIICNLRRPLSILRHWTGAGQRSRGDRCHAAFTNLQAIGIRGLSLPKILRSQWRMSFPQPDNEGQEVCGPA
jgi:hypothetical protein